jgi:hypothetical protein
MIHMSPKGDGVKGYCYLAICKHSYHLTHIKLNLNQLIPNLILFSESFSNFQKCKLLSNLLSSTPLQ